IAVDRFTKDESGNYETDFFNVVAWRRSAEFAANYLTKGRLVSVDGRLQTRSWVAQDGTKRSVVEIVADNIQGLDRKGDAAPAAAQDGDAAGASAPARAAAPAAAGAGSARQAAPADEDLDESDPFADEQRSHSAAPFQTRKDQS